MEKIAVELVEGTNMAISDNGMSQKTNKEINEILLSLAKKTLADKTFGNDKQIYTINEIIDVTNSMIKMRFEVRCIASSYKLTSNGVKYTPPSYEMFLVNEQCELCNDLHEIFDFDPYRDLLVKRNSTDIQDANGKIIEKGCHVVSEINSKTIEGEVIGYDMSTRMFTIKFDFNGKTDNTQFPNECNIGSLCQMYGNKMKIID